MMIITIVITIIVSAQGPNPFLDLWGLFFFWDRGLDMDHGLKITIIII